VRIPGIMRSPGNPSKRLSTALPVTSSSSIRDQPSAGCTQNQYDNWRKSRWNHAGSEKTIEVASATCRSPPDDPVRRCRGLQPKRLGRKHRSYRFLSEPDDARAPETPRLGRACVPIDRWLKGTIPEIADKWTRARPSESSSSPETRSGRRNAADSGGDLEQSGTTIPPVHSTSSNPGGSWSRTTRGGLCFSGNRGRRRLHRP
jgi:hypothetical protein